MYSSHPDSLVCPDKPCLDPGNSTKSGCITPTVNTQRSSGKERLKGQARRKNRVFHKILLKVLIQGYIKMSQVQTMGDIKLINPYKCGSPTLSSGDRCDRSMENMDPNSEAALGYLILTRATRHVGEFGECKCLALLCTERVKVQTYLKCLSMFPTSNFSPIFPWI